MQSLALEPGLQSVDFLAGVFLLFSEVFSVLLDEALDDVFFFSSLLFDLDLLLALGLFSDFVFVSGLGDDFLVLDFLEEDFVLLFPEPLRQCALTDAPSLRTNDFTQLQPVVHADCARPLHSCALAEVTNNAVVINTAIMAMVLINFILGP